MASPSAFAGSVPANYDKYLGPFFFEPYALDLIQRLKTRKLTNILELACGTGRVTKHLVSLIPDDGELIASDLNPDMIDVAKERIQDKKVKWQVIDAQELPFDNNSFDHIVCQFGVMFFPDKLKAFSEAHRVLQEDGIFIFNTWDHIDQNPATATVDEVLKTEFGADAPDFLKEGPFSFFDQHLIKQILSDSGFKNIGLEVVKIESSYADPEDVVKGFVDGSPLSIYLNEMEASVQARVREKLKEEFITRFGHQSSHVSLQAIVCQAMK